MGKKCVHLRSSPDSTVEIYCVQRIAQSVYDVWYEKGRIKRTRRIVEYMFKGEYDENLYANYPKYGVTAMKWKGGNENYRIYCQEIKKGGITKIVLGVVHKKKDNELQSRDIAEMNKVANQEYELLKL